MTEMSPQEAAKVWTQVPEVEQELTPRVVGLSNILTGLAIVVLAIPTWSLLSPQWPTWAVAFASLHGMVLLALVFLGVRAGLWRVYGLAKPAGRTPLYRYREPGSWKWLSVDWWYLAAFIWGLFGASWSEGIIARSAVMIPLFLTVYTLAGGRWEGRQSWSRRPYLLILGIVACGIGWGLQFAGVSGAYYGLIAIISLGWILAGTALYFQV